jgi:hypothetical protein
VVPVVLRVTGNGSDPVIPLNEPDAVQVLMPGEAAPAGVGGGRQIARSGPGVSDFHRKSFAARLRFGRGVSNPLNDLAVRTPPMRGVRRWSE